MYLYQSANWQLANFRIITTVPTRKELNINSPHHVRSHLETSLMRNLFLINGCSECRIFRQIDNVLYWVTNDCVHIFLFYPPPSLSSYRDIRAGMGRKTLLDPDDCRIHCPFYRYALLVHMHLGKPSCSHI